MLVQIPSCSTNPMQPGTQALEKHVPCGLAYAIAEVNKTELYDFQ